MNSERVSDTLRVTGVLSTPLADLGRVLGICHHGIVIVLSEKNLAYKRGKRGWMNRNRSQTIFI